MASHSQFDLARAGQLSEKIHSLLTEKECSIFNRGLADYHKRKSIKTFVECLSLVLNTGYKRKLLIPIREAYVKPSDLAKFNQLVQAQGLATSYRQRQKDAEKTSQDLKGDGLKKIDVKRDANGEWGFSIRGGSEHGLGIFVSWIEPGSNAEKCGLQVGDQILKANDTSFSTINHYDAVAVIQNAKKLQMHVLAHGRVPGSRMAHKVYHWVDPEGRPCSPPPDPFEIQDKAKGRDYKLISEADERKVTIMIDKGRDLGISIRGGIEHGLGIYISAMEEDSVADSYGIKIGDQILEVNGVSFLGIVHADAANSLRAQPCMVMKIKDVGKLPHSRITTYSNTKWYPISKPHGGSQTNAKIFKPGVGSQVMLGQQQNSLLQGHGLLKDMAKSVLNEQELVLFMYHINQYQQYDLPVDELLPPILNVLDNPEKLQLLAELRGLMKPQDIERFNELTVHKEIMAKKYRNHSPVENGGRDIVPKKLSPDTPRKVIQTPPTSTPGNLHSSLQLALNGDDAVDGPWGKSELSPIHSPQSFNGSFDTSIIEARVRSETESLLRIEFEEKQKIFLEEQSRVLEEERVQKEEALRLKSEAMEEQMKQKEYSLKAEIEESIRIETERELNAQLKEKEKLLQEEKDRLLEEKEQKQEHFQQQQEELKQQLEEQIWKEADEKLREEYEHKRQQEKEASLKRRTNVSAKAAAWDVEGRIRRDLENRIRKEYEEKLNAQLRKLKQQENIEREKMEEELERKKREEVERLEAEEQSRIELEEKIRREAELKVRAEFEARLQNEAKERVKLAEEVQARKSAEERLQRERIELQREREQQQKEFQKEREKERQEREKAMADIIKEKAELERQLLQQQQQNQQRQPEDKRQRDEQKQQEERVVRQQKEEKQRMEQKQRQEQKKQEELRRQEPQKQKSEPVVESESSDEEDGAKGNQAEDMTAAELQEQQQLEQQRRIRLNKEKEEERRLQQQLAEAENERKQQQMEQAKKKELERKREENIRKREENLRKKEEERRQNELERRDNQQPSPSLSRDPNAIMEKEKKRQEAERIAAVTSQQGKTNPGVEDSSLKRRKAKKAKELSIEEERRKAEERLQRRLKKSHEKKRAIEAKVIEEPIVPAGKAYGGFTELYGNILHIQVTKVVKKLGIAIDGGANTKQKAVIIRDISPEGCAAKTGMGMAVNQQILEVNGTSLFGLKHRDVVMEIKTAFDGPMNKTIGFVVHDCSE